MKKLLAIVFVGLFAACATSTQKPDSAVEDAKVVTDAQVVDTQTTDSQEPTTDSAEVTVDATQPVEDAAQ